MAEVAEIFNTLDDGAGAGEALRKVQIGDTVASKNGLIAIGFQDASGNATLPSLNGAGQLPVTLGSSGTPRRGAGSATPVALNTDFDVLVVALPTLSKLHTLQYARADSFKPGVYRVEHNNNGTPDVLARFVVGSGDYDGVVANCECIQFTTGASGTQELKIVGQQLRGGLSDVQGTLCALEAP